MSSIEAKVVTGHEESVYSESAKKYVDRWFNTPNSAGGVSARVNIYNNSGKEIKYLKFKCIPFNRVGDIVASEIGDKVDAYLQLTGPIAVNKMGTVTFENIWYNNTISNAIIDEVSIQYMDGTEEILSKDEIVIYGSKGSVSGEKNKQTLIIVGAVIVGLILIVALGIWGVIACAVAVAIYIIKKKKSKKSDATATDESQ